MLSDQSRAMNQIVADFQQQAATMTRNFNNSLADVENSYRAAFAAANIAPPQIERIVSTRALKAPKRIRKVEAISDYDQDPEQESETVIAMKNYKRESKKTLKSARRVQDQFDQLKAMDVSD